MTQAGEGRQVPDPTELPRAPTVDMRVFGRPSGPVPSGTNGFAIAALVFGLLGGLLGAIFGFVALNQIGRTGQRGRGLAIAGLVAFGAWFLVMPASLLVALASAVHSAPAAPVTAPTASSGQPPQSVIYISLRAGDCFDYTTDSAGVIRSVQWQLCSREHTAQVLGFFDVSGSVWLGIDGFRREASTRCRAMIAPGTEVPAGMRVFDQAPSQQAWDAGDHKVACFLNMGPGRTTTGSVPLNPSPGH